MLNRLVGPLAAAVFLAPSIAAAQISEIIDTTGDGAGNSLFTPRFVAADSSGSVYVTGALSDNAFEIDPSGVIIEGSLEAANERIISPAPIPP